jgi:hypothetical protein
MEKIKLYCCVYHGAALFYLFLVKVRMSILKLYEETIYILFLFIKP